MEKKEFEIVALSTGKTKKIGSKQFETSMQKDQVETLKIYKDRIEGDEVTDKVHHGGLDRVIHHYSLKNFDFLKQKFPEIKERFSPGSYGENLTTANLEEGDLCIGDIFKLGTALIQISEARNPCSTIDAVYETPGVLKEVFQSGRFGWMYRVLEEGEVKMGEKLILTDRPFPEINLAQLIQAKKDRKDQVLLKRAWSCRAISALWKSEISKILD